MKRAILAAVLLLSAATTSNAFAWTYVEIDNQGHARYFDRSPIDLTYPPDNVPTPMVYADDHSPPHGTLITPSEERQRRNSESLLIVDGLVPSSRAGSTYNSQERPLR
jgi:hypothetical protein